MKSIQVLFIAVALSVLARAQTCTNLNTSLTQSTIVLRDGTEHSSGEHYVATDAINVNPGDPPPQQTSNNVAVTCSYTHSGGSNVYCNTNCAESFGGGGTDSERGTLNTSGSHLVNFGSAGASAVASNGGASCSGHFGGAAANCLLVMGTCLVSVGFTSNGITVNTNGHQVWSASQDLPVSCPAVADPQGPGGTGGGNCGPPPPTGGGRSHLTDPGNPPDPSCNSPIIIDVAGEGFHLTSAADGVTFDIRGDGHPLRLAWTDGRFQNAFLALPGPDGMVRDGRQLFGNFTLQPPSEHPNGFLALAEYDKRENGGNSDGVIDERDAIWSKLRLWIDENHDGVSQLNELHKLDEFGIYSLSLKYFESGREDEFGNSFRYRARVNPDRNHRDRRDETPAGDVGRWTYDVFFVAQ
jgi:hypothetical protein